MIVYGIRVFDVGAHLSFFHFRQLRLAETTFVSRIHHTPNRALYTVANVQRPVRSHRQPYRSMSSITGIDDGIPLRKSVGEDFPIARRLAILERHKAHEIARLRIRRPYRGPMKCDESTVFVPVWKLITGIKQQIVRRPMPGKPD